MAMQSAECVHGQVMHRRKSEIREATNAGQLGTACVQRLTMRWGHVLGLWRETPEEESMNGVKPIPIERKNPHI